MASPVDFLQEITQYETLSDGNVFRGLNTVVFRENLPTEANFIMKKRDRLEDGPSHFIAPLVPRGIVPSLLTPPPEKWKIVELAIQEILSPVIKRDVQMVLLPDAELGQYSNAHLVLYGYQRFTNKELAEFQRHLVRLAIQALEKQN